MKKGAVLLLAGLVVLFLGVASLPVLIQEGSASPDSVTGNSIKESVAQFYETSSVGKRVFILTQVLLLAVIIFAAFIVAGKLKEKEKVSKNAFLKKIGNKRSRTDLDVLHEILKDKGEFGVEEVERTFGVKEDVALGWAKILENADLVEIDYPRFGKPILRLPVEKKEEDAEEKVEDKNKEKVSEEKIKKVVKKRAVKKNSEVSKNKTVKKVRVKTRKKAVEKVIKKKAGKKAIKKKIVKKKR